MLACYAMPPPSCCPSVRMPATRTELDALRAELRCILQHPAIMPVRRECAEQFISGCQQATQLQQWLALAVAECGSWEEHALAAEASSQRNGKMS